MKRTLHVLVPFLIACEFMFAVQPVRKPFIEIRVNDKQFQNRDILEVDKGDRIKLTISLEGGLRDYVKFVDSYTDIPEEAQILVHNENCLVYQIQNERYEWKLLNQELAIETDETITIQKQKTQANTYQVWINVPSQKLDKPYLNFFVKANWQYTEGSLVMQDEDEAEAILYLKIEGKTDEWYTSPNIKVSGNRDSRLEKKFDQIQHAYHAIEEKMIKRDFKATQIEIRNMQSTIQQTELLLKQIKNEKETFFVDVIFVGLPSDKPINDIDKLRQLINFWTELDPMLKLYRSNFDKLPAEPTDKNKKDLLVIAQAFDNWTHSVPKNSIALLNTYIPEINWEEKAFIQNYLSFSPEQKKINNLAHAYSEINDFLEKRSLDVPAEIQVINNTVNRLQVAKLFDRMLLGYISSINFSNWKSGRGSNNLQVY